jgi:hypothetical protein
VLPSLLSIAQQEGVGALYKGFVPKALRLGIGQSVGLIMFEQVRGASNCFSKQNCSTVTLLLQCILDVTCVHLSERGCAVQGLCVQGAANGHFGGAEG